MAITVLYSPGEISFSKDPIAVKLSTNTSLSTDNLELVLQLFVETDYYSGVFENVHTQGKTPDANGQATFYFNEILNDYFSESNFPTGFNQNTPQLSTTVVKRYYYRYTEKSGDPAELGDFVQGATKFVLNGGISFEAYTTLAFFTNYLTTKKCFLTWDQTTKKVTTNQQEYLYFLIYDDIIVTVGDPPSEIVRDIRVNIKVYFTDGTNTSIYRNFTHDTMHKWDVYIFPAGYTQLNLSEVDSEKNVSKYDIWLTYNEEEEFEEGLPIISETRTFIIDNKYYYKRRQFLFTNSLGGVNTLMATGNAKTKADIASSVANKFVAYNYDVKEGARKTNGKQESITVTISTGYKTYKEVDRLRDMLLSSTIKESLVGMFLPIIINKYSAQIYQDNDDLWYLTFDYERAYDNVSYTPSPDELGLVSGDYNNDFSDDFFINHLPS